MNDPYVWIDPFAEIERANNRAARAYNEGQRYVLDRFADDRRENMMKALDHAIEGCARRVATDFVEPFIRKHHMTWERARQMENARIDLLMTSLSPVTAQIMSDGKLSISPGYGETETFTVEYQTMQPIRVAYRIG